MKAKDIRIYDIDTEELIGRSFDVHFDIQYTRMAESTQTLRFDNERVDLVQIRSILNDDIHLYGLYKGLMVSIHITI